MIRGIIFPRNAPDAMTPDNRAFPTQIGCDLARTEERVFGEHPVNLFHHRQCVRVDANRRVIEGRPRQPHQFALLAPSRDIAAQCPAGQWMLSSG